MFCVRENLGTAKVRRALAVLLWLLPLSCVAAVGEEQTDPQSAIFFSPPDPPAFPPPPEFLVEKAAAKSAGGGGFLDIENRQTVADFYQNVYLSSEGTSSGWTGNIGSCTPGDTSDQFKEAVRTRINWYRAMAGVPDTVVFQTGPGSYSEKAQAAALMMSSNNNLSHYPSPTWDCYSAEGAQAAGSSNVALGTYGWDAISGQMEDYGTYNTAAGHRRWVLYPQTQVMGTGDVPGSSGHWPAHDLWVFDSHYRDPRPTTRDTFVAWPPPGYVPYQVVYPRWSFSYPGADFRSATVELSQGGNSIAVDLEPISNGYGENTLVWVAGDLNPATRTHWPAPESDTPIDVSIRNVRIDGATQDFNYRVTIFDPNQADSGGGGGGGGDTYSGAGALQLVDARYFYDEPVSVDGSGNLGNQTWGGLCDMTLMALDPTVGAVNILLNRNGTVENYRDTIVSEAPMFVYSLYNSGNQSFSLRSATDGESRVTAFFYCFQGDGDYQLSDARYLYDQAVNTGTGSLADQGWGSACDMTLMALDVLSGAVDIDLERAGTVVRYQDAIQTNDAMFVYSLYNSGSQGFRLSPSSQGGTRATAFYYCFNRRSN